MSNTVHFVLDGKEVKGRADQTIMQAAEEAGVYVPRLCAHKDLKPYGACRICTVLVNGRPEAACTQPVAEGAVVENDSEKIQQMRRELLEMLFVEGNHFCMFCEKSGNCELQALAYRYGVTAPQFPYLNPQRAVDASHPNVFLDRNRCVLCARCVRASKELDGKSVFQFVGRGIHKSIGINASANLANTELKSVDKAIDICPVGAILRRQTGFMVPIGERLYDVDPIGSDLEENQLERQPALEQQ